MRNCFDNSYSFLKSYPSLIIRIQGEIINVGTFVLQLFDLIRKNTGGRFSTLKFLR